MNLRQTIGTMTIVGVIAAVLGWAAFGKLYYLRDDSGGQVLSNTGEAYLFVSVARRGYRVRVVDYPWLALRTWLNAPPFPSDQRVFFTVIRVTPSGIERHEQNAVEGTADKPDFFTPIGGAIYANCQGTPCKWVGDRFEKVTQEEQEKLDGINHLAADIDTTINGWSKRGVRAPSGDVQFSIGI